MVEEAEVVSTSPVIKKGTAKTYSFTEAIPLLLEGKRMTRLEWGSNDDYGFLHDERLKIHTKGQDHLWIVSTSDMVANDWVVLPQAN